MTKLTSSQVCAIVGATENCLTELGMQRLLNGDTIKLTVTGITVIVNACLNGPPKCIECEGRGFTYFGEGNPGNGFDVAPEPPEQECCQACGGSGYGAFNGRCADPIVEQNVELLRERSTVGVQKYGTTLADNKLTHKQWLRHALEELLDGANYLQAALQQGDEQPLVRYSPYMRGREGQEHASMTTDTNGEWVRLADIVGIKQRTEQLNK